MKFAVAAILGFAMTAVAIPAAKESQQKRFINKASAQCAVSDTYCCSPRNADITDVALNLVLEEGTMIESVLNGQEFLCAATTVAQGVNELVDALFRPDGDSFDCKDILSCCNGFGIWRYNGSILLGIKLREDFISAPVAS
ncbi:spore-wall fungal hydrophobin dewA [Aspergillus costaricaensis CBS 115574]|uniref:Spore-wall fungal hydrophobin dewA n=1 Tax=Aspergillus costaricaensis CBS 115574 TaxID=1448317 RepID=A0ACD1IJ38_9EURO|nr:spore-wall fungal hydrophobin dewA [Aspergillus costaricaensis CBS 115574]RAK90588.1 spore-wall fungal hydrophobin dewA [Aspergillus costaricaensis CBS 115574]